RHLFRRIAAEVERVAALFAVEEQVLDPDVGEGAADHDVVVAAAAAVAVEVRRLDAARLQEAAGGRVLLDVAGRGDVVGGDGVAEQAQHAGAVDVRDATHLHAHALEVGRVFDVGGGLVPSVQLAVRRGDGVPAAVALEHVGVVLLEQLRADGGGDDVADLL